MSKAIAIRHWLSSRMGDQPLSRVEHNLKSALLWTLDLVEALEDQTAPTVEKEDSSQRDTAPNMKDNLSDAQASHFQQEDPIDFITQAIPESSQRHLVAINRGLVGRTSESLTLKREDLLWLYELMRAQDVTICTLTSVKQELDGYVVSNTQSPVTDLVASSSAVSNECGALNQDGVRCTKEAGHDAHSGPAAGAVVGWYQPDPSSESREGGAMTTEADKELAWERFKVAVAECRRLEKKHGLKVWGYGTPENQWPQEYVIAVRDWDAARIARNKLYKPRVSR